MPDISTFSFVELGIPFKVVFFFLQMNFWICLQYDWIRIADDRFNSVKLASPILRWLLSGVEPNAISMSFVLFPREEKQPMDVLVGCLSFAFGFST